MVSPRFVNTDFVDGSGNEEMRKQLTASRDRMAMSPGAIASAIVYAIGQPANVDVGEIVVRPTAQA